ncbi:FAD binding domain-containing protein [Plectosphaerella cucumerina]|uniref:FAD binding domain-containing protein n=1 Tax=Plectosphaerella cucumerina TaxID=40658 RepID=A0A8K0TNR0_9PEZI|nr:FAD binding domain-containing protein [Plectosphaerella cucumerina]
MARLTALLSPLLALGVWVSAPSLTYAQETEGAVAAQRGSGSAQAACTILKWKYPAQTLFNGTDGYTFESETQYWSARNHQDPACVFVPENAQQVSFAVTTFTLTLTRFAVRGGGHMPIVGSNSIGSDGVLLSTTGLSGLALNGDKTVVSVGAGNRWRDVYGFLQPHSLAAVGGRIGGVGVPGLLLGGGISFHSSQYGFASDNVVRYEAILASGAVVEATASNSYKDLFWALRGGGNSFAIVTRFDLRTVPSSKVWVGISQYSPADSNAYLDAVYNFGKYGSADAKAAIIPTILTVPSFGLTAYAAARFYDSEQAPATAFENFTAPVLTPVDDSVALQPLADYIRATHALQPTGLRQEFRVLSILANRDAISHIHDTFLAAAAGLASVPGLLGSISFQPVTAAFLQNGQRRGGLNPQGIDISKAPYFWIVLNVSWQANTDDAAAVSFAESVTAQLEKSLSSKGVAGTYLYLNDAGPGQPIFERYPPPTWRV